MCEAQYVNGNPCLRRLGRNAGLGTTWERSKWTAHVPRTRLKSQSRSDAPFTVFASISAYRDSPTSSPRGALELSSESRGQSLGWKQLSTKHGVSRRSRYLPLVVHIQRDSEEVRGECQAAADARARRLARTAGQGTTGMHVEVGKILTYMSSLMHIFARLLVSYCVSPGSS